MSERMSALQRRRQVLLASRSRGAGRLVLLALLWHANRQGEVWPSVETIAALAACDPTTVRRGRKALVELGELEILDDGAGRRRTTSCLIPALASPAVTLAPEKWAGCPPNAGAEPAHPGRLPAKAVGEGGVLSPPLRSGDNTPQAGALSGTPIWLPANGHGRPGRAGADERVAQLMAEAQRLRELEEAP